MNTFTEALGSRKASGEKSLVVYLTAGMRDDWLDVVDVVSTSGADGIEIGIPFSDPVMDGPVIQAASELALQRGATPGSVFAELEKHNVGVPLAAMTYYNIVAHRGELNFAEDMRNSGVAAAILPDLPYDESEEWCVAADSCGIETVMLVAPNTPDERLKTICRRSRGFVYAIGTTGVTGERTALAESATQIATRANAVTDLPVLVGIGISTPEQAEVAAAVSDGVVVGSVFVRKMLEGASLEELGSFVRLLKSALK